MQYIVENIDPGIVIADKHWEIWTLRDSGSDRGRLATVLKTEKPTGIQVGDTIEAEVTTRGGLLDIDPIAASNQENVLLQYAKAHLRGIRRVSLARPLPHHDQVTASWLRASARTLPTPGIR